MLQARNPFVATRLHPQTATHTHPRPETRPNLLKDTPNPPNKGCLFNKVSKCLGDDQNEEQPQENDQTLDAVRQSQSEKQSRPTKHPKVCSQSSSVSSKQVLSENNSNMSKIMKVGDMQEFPSGQPTPTPLSTLRHIKGQTNQRKSGLLMVMQFEDQKQDQSRHSQTPLTRHLTSVARTLHKRTGTQPIEAIVEKEELSTTKEKKSFLMGVLLQEEDCQISSKVQEHPSIASNGSAKNKRMVIRLAGLLSRFGKDYYLRPIPYGAVFECVVKRERCQSSFRLQLFDGFSLRNFITVFKDQYGYLIVANDVEKSKGSGEQKDTVIGRVVSNFFGTHYSCSLESLPYFQSDRHPVKQGTEKVIAVEYQTNVLGLKGPRRLAAYIPAANQKKHQNLRELYQKEAKKFESSVLRFKNKSPEWCKEVNAYVLDFNGRVSVPSIKNFILVGQKQGEQNREAVVFGKCGREMFNLDVRHPFSVIQAVTLALSAFDGKIGCQ